MHAKFAAIRELYQQTRFIGGGHNFDLWTWHDGHVDYPSGWRPFIKLVDRGRDLTLGNSQVRRLEERVPIHGACGQSW